MRRLGVAAVTTALLLAALARWPGLGRDPLDPREASQSIAAWWTLEPPGEALASLVPPAQSPLLLGLDVAAFWLLDSATDALARAIPAVAGTALVLLALLVRPRSWSMVAPTAIALALDPWLVAMSRRASGVVLAAGAAISGWLLLRRLVLAPPTAALAAAAHRQWLWWAAAAGCVAVAGPAAWDFLPPMIAAAVLAARGPLRGSPRPHAGWLAAAGVAVGLVAATTGLVQWNGPSLVTSSLESWLLSWNGRGREMSIANLARLDGWVVLYLVALAALAAWGLARAWAVRGGEQGAGAGRALAPSLALWLLWGALMQLRVGSGPEVWLALEVPMLLAAALALERVLAPFEREGGGWAPRAVLAVLAVVTVGATLAGVETAAPSSVSLPAVRRLAADLAVLTERPAPDRPRVEVVNGSAIDGVLAWYLRAAHPRWVSAPTEASESPRLAVVSTVRDRAAEPAPNTAPRYAVSADGDSMRVVELQ